MWPEVKGIHQIARAKDEKCYREYLSQYRLHDCDLMMQFNEKSKSSVYRVPGIVRVDSS
jgi:hypothetical protein